MRPRRNQVLAQWPPRAIAVLGLAVLFIAGGAADEPGAENALVKRATRMASIAGDQALNWYRRTPPTDRMTMGGLVACGLFGSLVFLERTIKIRRRRYIPNDFLRRFQERLREGKLDRGKALDLCELNPSPAARVALAAIKRWGRPITDLERAISMVIRVEADKLRRNVGTLRRLAVLAPLIGLLGTLLSAARLLSQAEIPWTQSVGTALGSVTIGVVICILLLVAYDGMTARLEGILGALERLGAETVDAIAMSHAVDAKPAPESRQPSFETHRQSSFESPRPQSFEGPRTHEHRRHPSPPRTPHQIRVDIPDAMIRAMEQDDDLYDV